MFVYNIYMLLIEEMYRQLNSINLIERISYSQLIVFKAIVLI